jgi:hypothetical protein
VAGAHLKGCTFDGCTWGMVGPAANTIKFLPDTQPVTRRAHNAIAYANLGGNVPAGILSRWVLNSHLAGKVGV